MHIHGSSNADVMDASPEALQTICSNLAKLGTTAFLATTMSEPVDHIEKALANIAHFDNTTGAEILGIHLEGPFLAPSHKGAQDGHHLLNPDISLFQHWQLIANNKIKLVTVAPELDNAIPFIRHLQAHKVIASVGHSNASFEQTNQAIDVGCSHATHLFNAMGKLHHRAPGTAGALLLSDKVMAEVVADFHHLHPGLLELTYRIKGREKCLLITDATRAQCMPEGQYNLGGQSVFVKDGCVKLEDGTIAGSILTQAQAAINMQSVLNCDVLDLVYMTAINPAKALGVYDRKGSIAVGKDADLVVLDEQFNVVMSICRGEIVYQRK
jgi:N-acetylglucosamine-6-phosphate deacetylase